MKKLNKNNQEEVKTLPTATAPLFCDNLLGLKKDAEGILEALNQATIKKNERYAKMSKMKKRVALAKDVLRLLDAKKFRAKNRVYVKMIDREFLEKLGATPETTNEGVRESATVKAKKSNALRAEVQCEVCAIGSLFAARMLNDKDQGMISDDVKMVGSLKDLYTHKEMRAMECLFEGFYSGHDGHRNTGKNPDTIREWFRKYNPHVNGFDTLKPEKTLRALMENIIENKGVFTYKDVTI